MNGRPASYVILLGLALSPAALVAADDASALRLVPFPKEVSLQAGGFRMNRPLVVRTGPKADDRVSQVVLSELRRAGGEATAVVAPDLDDRTLEVRAGTISEDVEARPAGGDEGYALRVGPNGATVHGAGPAGLRHGVATLAQLIRANRGPGGLPCLLIHDWPTLRWRCFQDDLTRGPSTRPRGARARARPGIGPEAEHVHVLHGIPVRLQEAPAHRAGGRFAASGGARAARRAGTLAGDRDPGQPAVVRPLGPHPGDRPVRPAPGDGRRAHPDEGGDVSAPRRSLLGGLPGLAVRDVQRLLRRDPRPGHGALERPRRGDRRRGCLRASRCAVCTTSSETSITSA